MKRKPFLMLSASALVAAPAIAKADADAATPLEWARAIVAEVAPENNFYGSRPTYVEWADAQNHHVARNRSVCSSFASRLLERSYGYTPADIDAWFGKSFPQAREYHDTIAARRGFVRVFHIDAIRPGDVIAIKYPDGSRPTGHVMIAASAAEERTPSAPFEPGTRQFAIDVIDSANTGHGTADTRYRAGEKWITGVGRGTLRLYAHADGTFAGHAWSLTRHSTFRPQRERTIAIGRYDPHRAPAPSGTANLNAPRFDGPDLPDDAADGETQ